VLAIAADKHRLITFLLIVLAGVAAAAQAPSTLTAAQAQQHLGERATVCGKVATANFASGARGQPTFLNLDAPYPKAIFTVVIWRDMRSRLGGSPEVSYKGQTICVSGQITSYRGDPQIVISDPKQISIKH
jgi:DNA/RNA endonuclease YhcR with UshA esterase domain